MKPFSPDLVVKHSAFAYSAVQLYHGKAADEAYEKKKLIYTKQPRWNSKVGRPQSPWGHWELEL